jgi:hypothetical protein
MCSINHNLKAIYFHIPKVGGLYIEKVLQKFYNFQTFYITADNHSAYFSEDNNRNDNRNNISEFKGFLNIRTKGIYRYFINSRNFNYISNMNDEKWKTYKKFTFIRNPYERCISAYKYLELYKKNIPLENYLSSTSILNNYEYVHLIISQYDHLVNNDDSFDFDYIGKFENLNEELITILLKIGITELKHLYYIENNITVNSYKEKECEKKYLKNNYLNDNVMHLINNLFQNDFKKFDYIIYDSYEKYNLLKIKNDIIKQNNEILKKFNFKKPYNCIYIDIKKDNDNNHNNHNDINHNDIKSNRPSKKDIEYDIKNNILLRLS